MARNESIDNLRLDLNLPYDRSIGKLSSQPRISSGTNSYVTTGGEIAKRPGTIQIPNSTLSSLRIDRIYMVETIDSPSYVYLLVSAYNSSSTKWEIHFIRLDDGAPSWKRASYIGNSVFTGSGLDDATSGGYYTDTNADIDYTVEIDSTGSPDTFKWKKASASYTTSVAITGSAQTLSDGITITFAATTGHTSADVWVITGYKDLRDVNASVLPHEVVISRGLAYIKAFPASGSSEKLGTVIFDATANDPVFTLWGIEGPTTAARVQNTSTWGSASHSSVVRVGWIYAYAWKSITGHISSRSEKETNPDLNQSKTDAFSGNTIPQIKVQGHSDIDNIPTVVLYRTSDGGGTYVYLDEAANTGSGDIVMNDDSLESGAGGGTFNDPVPDDKLDFSVDSLSPTDKSNDPPPTVTSSSGTVGTDTPVPSSPLVTFAGRIWYAIGNEVHFSAQEEILQGIPEEAFPSGLRGNYFRFPEPVSKLLTTQDYLYVFCTSNVHIISGSSKSTFAARTLLGGVGAPEGHPMSAAVIGDAVVWLTQDQRIAALEGTQFRVISPPLGSDIVDAADAGREFYFAHWAGKEKDWLVVSAMDTTTPADSCVWIFDLAKSKQTQRDFWNTPWTINATAVYSGRIEESPATARLIFGVYDGTNSVLVRVDETGATAVDYLPAGNVNFGMDFTTGMLEVPAGNHVNELRKPGLTLPVGYVEIERTRFDGDTNPDLHYYLDDTWTDQKRPGTPEEPARRVQSKGYRTVRYPVDENCQRIAVKIEVPASELGAELQTITIAWVPEEGG